MTAQAGYFPNRFYVSQDGDAHMNGANLWDVAELALAQKVTFSIAAGSANVCLVTLRIQDGAGNNLTRSFEAMCYLSDDATANGLTGTSASGAVAAGAAGTDLSVKQVKKATDILTDNTGTYILSITDTAKTGFFVAVINPGTGNVQVSRQLVAGDYG